MRTFCFDTGAQPYAFDPPSKVPKGHIVRGNGVMVIPFDCEDVPEEAVFQFACDHRPPDCEHLLMREMFNTKMLSRYAFFLVPEKHGTETDISDEGAMQALKKYFDEQG